MAERGIIFKDDFVTTPGKSWFDMSFDFLFSSNFGELVPTTCMECMAEDVIHAKSDSFTRLAPMVAPAFGKVNQFSYHFYVRNRDIWTHWDSFFTNADQRKSWQSSIGTTFTPPVMPYVDVRKFLYNNPMFFSYGGNQSDLFMYDKVVANNKTTITFLNQPADLHYLVLWDDGDNLYSGVMKNRNSIPDWAYDCLVFAFIPNKDEVTQGDVFRLSEQSRSPYRYNPFSNGTLFDYLGVDLNDMYKRDNQAYWQNFPNFVVTTLGLDPIDPIYSLYNITASKFTPTQYDWTNSAGYTYTIIEPYEYSESFFDDHCIVGAFYFDNANNNASLSPKKRYFMFKNGTDSYGDYVNSNSDKLNRVEESCKISTLPIRAYYFIYSEYFRDQNYVDVNSNVDFTRDGEDIDWNGSTLNDIYRYFTLQLKSWEHDPYTSALPGTQRGSRAHFLPERPELRIKTGDLSASPKSGVKFDIGTSSYNSAASNSAYPVNAVHPASASNFYDGTAYIDLSAATIENFRFANATQRYLEKVARSGSRYYEYMRAIFGADIADAKLNRPIYLGGDKTPIQVSEVLQTSASQLSDDQPLGQMAGRAVAIGNDDYLEFVTPDNGFFIEISTIIPRVSYQQGINPMFTRKVQLDYPLPDYAQLGEEPVKQQELYFIGNSTDDDKTFGFQSRYYQWKYKRDACAGTFKSSLDHWTWTRKFDSEPVAGRKFLEVRPDYRQFAVTNASTEHAYCHMWHDIQVQRALPVFGTPSL